MIQKEHYPVHLNIQMYYKNSDVNEINNYDQFLISSCQLIIFIVDNVFVEIYAKNQTILERILKIFLRKEVKKHMNLLDNWI